MQPKNDHEKKELECPQKKERTRDEENAEAMKQIHKLTTEQLYMFDYQLYTPMSTMYNLFVMLRLPKDAFELSRLVQAIKSAIQGHPAMLTKFSFDEDGAVVQSYDPLLMPDIRVEKISEADFLQLKDTLVQPFKMVNSRLFRVHLFETESFVYFFMDCHHSISDGLSCKIFLNSIARAYQGGKIKQDYYYLNLKNREELAHTPFYEESRKYFENCYDGEDWITFPPVDHVTRENQYGHLECPLEIDKEKLCTLEKHYAITHNEFFIVVSALAVSRYADYPNVKLSWIHNGRGSIGALHIVGLLYRDLPVAFRFDKCQKISDIYRDVHEQVKKAVEYSCYPYVEKNAQVVEKDVACVLYQRDIRDAGRVGKTKVEEVQLRQNRAASQNILDIEILDAGDGLQLSLGYASSRYDRSTMEKFKDIVLEIAKALVRCDFENDMTIGELFGKKR